MNRVLLAAPIAAACAATPLPPSAPKTDPRLAPVAWIAGSWRSESDGKVSEEHWTLPEGGAMLGVARTLSGGEMVHFEHLRIEHTPEGLFYVAVPSGQELTRFRAVETSPHRVVFENPQHDFPSRVIYWLDPGDPERLHARIEGSIEGQPRSSEWSWRRLTWRSSGP